MKKKFTILITGLMLMLNSAFSQAIEVRGKVSDILTGEGLPGVNILVKGTATGTTTDIDGNYIINVNSGDVLLFSFIGFLTEEIVIGSKNTIDVVMVADIEQLSEVVIIGYGEVDKKDLTGSVAQVKAKDLPIMPSANLEPMLQGKVPGLSITNSSGEPGAASIVQLRGGASIGGNNSPLIILDGFPLDNAGDLRQIAPQDVASVEVLKDASTIAIYGTRAANGLILITTKRGTEGRNEVSINAQTSVTNVITDNLPITTDPILSAQLANESVLNDTRNFVIPFSGEKRNGTYFPTIAELESDAWPYQTNWVDFVLRQALTQNVNVAFSGGSDKGTFRLSGTYFDQEGTVIGNDYSKISGAFAVQQNVLENVKVNGDVKVSFINDVNSEALGGIGRFPAFPVYNPDGTLFFIEQDQNHPIVLSEDISRESENLDLILQTGLDWGIFDFLDFKTNVGVRIGNSITDTYNPRTTLRGASTNGEGIINNFKETRILSESVLTYTKEFNEDHRIKALLGTTYQDTEFRSSRLTSQQFVNDVLRNQALQAGTLQLVENNQYRTRILSQFGRIDYTLFDKYLVTLTGRRDGHSQFGANNKWGFFPAAAVAWKVHEENFMQSAGAISQLKLRASYGVAGSVGALNPYNSLNLLVNQSYPNGNTRPVLAVGFGPDHNQFGSPDLKWETTNTLDIGVDLSFLEGRVNLTADYYVKRTTDVLRRQPLPFSSLHDFVLVNNGEIENKGLEIALDATVVSNDDFRWNINANAFFNRNTLIDIDQPDTDGFDRGPFLENFRDRPARLQVGQTSNIIWGFKTDGIIQEGEIYDVRGLEPEDYLPGEYKYVDLNNDGVIDEKDRTVIGDVYPDLTLGFTNNLEYKGFSLNVLLTASLGQDIFNAKKFDGPDQAKRWTPENPTNEWPSLRGGRRNRISDWWIEDGSFMRVANVTLGYDFAMEKVKHVSNLRVFVTGDNLAVITGYSGYDPEISSGFDPNVANSEVPNIDNGGYPRARTFTLGLNVSFQ
ncbi:TonB-dependent receptor [Fulvivirga sp. M361]|uniref:SusC/RagA family TonB-linked outer membrane protein n=1 Tax=Fulvivirga sp. M361 TaxID=2594266 RepID=UPI00117B80D0|nr:TonB-dependent receptor [Fulvivirga sp. M361]TRX59954.1 TonB-dependent receptor [Fulvivirga sp. M361]